MQVVGNEGADRAGAMSLEYGSVDYFTVGSAFMRQHGKDLPIGFQGDTYRHIGLQVISDGCVISIAFQWSLISCSAAIRSASIEPNKTDELDLESMEYDIFKYNLSLANLTAFLTVRDDEDELSVEPKVNSKVSRNLFLSYAGDYQYIKDTHEDSYLHTVELAKSGFSDTPWNISGTVNGSGHHERTELSLRNACKECVLDPFNVFQELTTNGISTLSEAGCLVYGLLKRVNPYLLFSWRWNRRPLRR